MKRKKKLRQEFIEKTVCQLYVEREKNLCFYANTKAALFHQIVDELCAKYEMNKDEFHFPFKTALSRISRDKYKADGRKLPLEKIEEKVITLILTMSKLKCSLRSNECIKLINDLIKGTQVQAELLEWKKLRKTINKDGTYTGTIGRKYWIKIPD